MRRRFYDKCIKWFPVFLEERVGVGRKGKVPRRPCVPYLCHDSADDTHPSFCLSEPLGETGWNGGCGWGRNEGKQSVTSIATDPPYPQPPAASVHPAITPHPSSSSSLTKHDQRLSRRFRFFFSRCFPRPIVLNVVFYVCWLCFVGGKWPPFSVYFVIFTSAVLVLSVVVCGNDFCTSITLPVPHPPSFPSCRARTVDWAVIGGPPSSSPTLISSPPPSPPLVLPLQHIPFQDTKQSDHNCAGSALVH